MIIRSTYQDSSKEQFEMEVVGEGIDSTFHQPCYLCRFLPKWQKEFQNGTGIHEIRKCLVGEGELYIIKSKPTMEQLSLFEL